MPSETRLSQRSEQVAQGAVTEKVQTLVCDFELYLPLAFAGLTANPRFARRIEGLIDRDVILLLHAVDELFDQFVELAFVAQLLDLLLHVLIQKVSGFERLLDGLAQLIECLLAQFVKIHVRAMESTLQQIVGERIEQVLHPNLGGSVPNIFGVLGEFHRSQTRRSSVVRPPAAAVREVFALIGLLRAAHLLVLCDEAALLAASDALMCVQSFQKKLRSAYH